MVSMNWFKQRILDNSTLLKFLLVGVLNTMVGLGSIFVLYNTLHFNYWISTSLGNILGIICSYILNKSFTFQSKKSANKTIWKFILVSIVCYLFSYYLGHLFNVFMHTNDLGSKNKLIENTSIFVASVLYTLCNYIGHKYFTFKED